MTSFVHLNHSKQHPGVTRVESALTAAHELRHGFSGTRGLATLLLSAVAAAVMVVAYQVMDSVAEGHLLVIWVAMWAVAFAVLALFAGTARNLAARVKAGLDGWSRSLAEARADQRLWEVARSDPRVMADLQTALLREESRTGAATVPAVTPSVPAASAMLEEPAKKMGSSALLAFERGYYV